MEKITKRQQLLYRFYKEKKIYKNYKHLNNIYCCDFFDQSLRWSSTKEGHEYWLSIQCDFIIFLVENDKDGVFGKIDDFKFIFNKLLTKGYFIGCKNSDNADNIYVKYKNLFSKIFKCGLIDTY